MNPRGRSSLNKSFKCLCVISFTSKSAGVSHYGEKFSFNYSWFLFNISVIALIMMLLNYYASINSVSKCM